MLAVLKRIESKVGLNMTVAAVAVAVACLTALAGCLGVTARDEVLQPAVVMAWEGVKEDVARGPNPSPPAFEAFDIAVNGESREVLAGLVPTVWPGIKAVAEDNIALSEMSAGVKASRLERVNQFDLAIKKLAERLE